MKLSLGELKQSAESWAHFAAYIVKLKDTEISMAPEQG